MGRTLGLATIAISGVLAGAWEARAQNLDAGKTPAQLFSGSCSSCHRGSRGLVKSISPGALPGFLREHYTTSPSAAAALSAFLVAGGTGGQAGVIPRRDGTVEEPTTRRQKQAAASPDGQPEASSPRSARNQPRQTPPGAIPDVESAEPEPAPPPGVRGRPSRDAKDSSKDNARDARAKSKLAKAEPTPTVSLPPPPEPAPVILPPPPKALVDIGPKPAEAPPGSAERRQEAARTEPAARVSEPADANAAGKAADPAIAARPEPAKAEEAKAGEIKPVEKPVDAQPSKPEAPARQANVDPVKPAPSVQPAPTETKAEPVPSVAAAPAATENRTAQGKGADGFVPQPSSGAQNPAAGPAPPISY